MTSTRKALSQIKTTAQYLVDNSASMDPKSLRRKAITILDLASLAIKNLPNLERKAGATAEKTLGDLPLFAGTELELGESVQAPQEQVLVYAGADHHLVRVIESADPQTHNAFSGIQALGLPSEPQAPSDGPIDAPAPGTEKPVIEIIGVAPGMEAHIDRGSQTITVSVDHSIYQGTYEPLIKTTTLLQSEPDLPLTDTQAQIETVYDKIPPDFVPTENQSQEMVKEAVSLLVEAIEPEATQQETQPSGDSHAINPFTCMPVHIIKGSPIDAQQAPMHPECLFCGGLVQLTQEQTETSGPIWACCDDAGHIALMSKTDPVMLWCPAGIKSWGSATATTVPGWARQLTSKEPHCPRCGEAYAVSECSQSAPEQEWLCTHCHLAFRVYRSPMAGTRCMALDKTPGVEDAQWITCFVPEWVKTSNNCPAKESKQEASNIEILALVTGKGISDATEALISATHAISFPTQEAQATLSALGITNTPKEASHISKNTEDPEELIAQIKSYETEIQLMALKVQTPELEERARELDALIEPLRIKMRAHHMANIRNKVNPVSELSAPELPKLEPLAAVDAVPVVTLADESIVQGDIALLRDGWIFHKNADGSQWYTKDAAEGSVTNLRHDSFANKWFAVYVSPIDSDFPHEEPYGDFDTAQAAAEFVNAQRQERAATQAQPEELAELATAPATSNDDLSPASPWIETGACPVCSGDLALYRQLFPADGAHAEWVCLSSEWQHRLSPRLYDSSMHVLKNGTEYRDIPTSDLRWLDKYRASGRMGCPPGPPGRRYICDQCCQPRLDVLPVMNGMHHCGDCREPGDEHPYQQVQQDLEKKRAAQLQQLQQLQQNHQATEKGN